MGRTKALVCVDGQPMAARVVTALRGGGCGEVVLVGGDPVELAPLGAEVLADLHPGSGPLGGVLTALAHFERSGYDAVAVVACDVPWLESGHVRALVGAFAAASPDAEVAVAHSGRRQPACAIWRTSLLAQLEQCFDAGGRALHDALAGRRLVEVELPADALRNVNTPADLPARDG